MNCASRTIASSRSISNSASGLFVRVLFLLNSQCFAKDLPKRLCVTSKWVVGAFHLLSTAAEQQ